MKLYSFNLYNEIIVKFQRLEKQYAKLVVAKNSFLFDFYNLYYLCRLSVISLEEMSIRCGRQTRKVQQQIFELFRRKRKSSCSAKRYYDQLTSREYKVFQCLTNSQEKTLDVFKPYQKVQMSKIIT